MTEGLRPGVHCIAATPFLPHEAVDLESIGTLMDYLIAGGCQGALVLGVLGEADRMSDYERDQVLAAALERGGNDLQISVGITHNSTKITKERADAAQAAGVAAVMVSPPPGSAAGPALKEHFKRIAADLSIPFIVQDHPTSSGVKMPVEFIASLYEFLPPGSVCKLEDPPTPIKMNKLRELEPGYQIFGGLGGVSLLHELDAGSAGAMTGFAAVEALVEIVSAYQAGDRDLRPRRFRTRAAVDRLRSPAWRRSRAAQGNPAPARAQSRTPPCVSPLHAGRVRVVLTRRSHGLSLRRESRPEMIAATERFRDPETPPPIRS